MEPTTIDKEKRTKREAKKIKVDHLLPKEQPIIGDPTKYTDELKALDSKDSNGLQDLVDLIGKKPLQEESGESLEGNSVEGNGVKGNSVKKPRYDEKSQPNAQKCRYSPFSYHRFTRAHKERAKSGSVIMVLRCRYCFEMQQVIIDFVLKDGRYVAQKTTSAVLEGPQTL